MDVAVAEATAADEPDVGREASASSDAAAPAPVEEIAAETGGELAQDELDTLASGFLAGLVIR